jgi:hypothetical protein
MSKTHDPKKSKSATTLRTPKICDSNWPGNYNDPVQWQDVPAAGCTISPDGTNIFPFSPNPVKYPLDPGVTPTIAVKPPTTQSYSYSVSCCANEATKNVVVTG